MKFIQKFSLVFLLTLILISPNINAQDSLTELVIKPGDILEIFVWDNEDLSRTVPLKMDGRISMPLVGSIEAQGLTAAELKENLEKKLEEYIKRPKVSVIFQKHANWVVYIFGAIENPLNRGTEYQFFKGLKLAELCIKAGGFKDNADISDVKIIRTLDDGTRRQIEVDVGKILKGEKPDVPLQMRDAVYVPKSSLNTWNIFIRDVLPTLNFIATLVALSALL